jgi:hypothetical protein
MPRKLVVSAWLSAEQDLEQARAGEQPNEWTQSGVLSAFYRSILRVLVFARQLLGLVKQGAVTIDRVDSEVHEFRRRLTIEAWYEQGHDRHGRKIPSVTENHSGRLRVEVDRAFNELPEWYQYKEEFRAFAQAQAQPVPAGNSAPAADRGPVGSPPTAKPDTTPRRSPDLETSQKRIALQDALASELATIKIRVRRFCDAAMLKREFPDFELWNQISETELQELARGENFTPKAFAGSIAGP